MLTEMREPDKICLGYRDHFAQAKEIFLRYSNSKIYQIILLLLLCIIIPQNNTHAGWSENMRLTYRGNEISPQVIARNDTVHVVWTESITNSARVSYIRSTDGGQTWGPIVDLSAPNHPCPDANPTLNQAERGLLVSWFDWDPTVGITTIGIRKSSNAGTTWGNPSYVYTDNPNHFGLPVSAVKGDSIFLAYFSERDDSTGSRPFKSLHSYNYGTTWSDEVTMGHPFVLMPQPIRMSYCSGTLLVAWAGTADSSRRYEVHIYGYRSTDAGRTWSDTIWISPNIQYDAQTPCMTCNKSTGQIIVGYMDYRYQIYASWGDIFASISDNNGLQWHFETQPSTHHTAAAPSFEFTEDTLTSVWADIQFNISGEPEIVFNRSNDGGLTWLGEQRLTQTEGESGAAVLSMDRGNIHVVWAEVLNSGAIDLFYKRFTPDSTDNIEESGTVIPKDFAISAYPNPFNSSLIIDISSKESGIINIYDIQGRIITKYLYNEGNHKILWDAKGDDNQPLPSGIYFIGRKGDSKNNIKVVHVK